MSSTERNRVRKRVQTVRTPAERRAFADVLFAPQVRRAVFVAFVVATAMLGGGARADIVSLVLLRPLAVLFGLYASLAMPKGGSAAVKGVLLFLIAAFAVVAVQLFPLPPMLWHSLPGRAPIAEVDSLLGLEGTWRPLALSPAGAWNAFFSLFVPLTALLLFAALDPGDRHLLPGVVILVAVLSAVLGILQMLGGPSSALYFYRITNEGTPVGLFANRNHNAVFLAAAIPVVACWVSIHRNKPGWRVAAGWAAIALFAFVALISGSRAGAALMLPGLIAGGFLMREAAAHANSRTAAPKRDGSAPLSRRWLLIGIVALLAALLAAALLKMGGIGFTYGAGASREDEVRVIILPTLWKMLKTFWSVGAGAGSFEAAYKIYEPTHLLRPYYINHAHDDVLELLIDFGVAGIVLLIAAIMLSFRAGVRIWRNRHFSRAMRTAVLMPLAILAAASLVDYPLRTPSIAVFVTLWVSALLTAGQSFAPVLGKRSVRRDAVYASSSIG